MTTKRLAILKSLLSILPFVLVASLGAQGKRPLNSDDIYKLREVRDPQVSPDGTWVAYTVTRAIKETDKNDTDVWMVSWDGRQQIQVTSTPESESSPRWSPDGTYLAFLSSRQGSKGAQIWLLNRAGGEAVKLTEIKGGVSSTRGRPTAGVSFSSLTNPTRPRPTPTPTRRTPTRTRRHQSRS